MTGYGGKYLRTVEIESQYSHGLDLDDRVKMETEFTVRSSELQFHSGDKILDLACGAGAHARCFAERWPVHVVGMDIEPVILFDGRRMLSFVDESTRARIRLILGDMGTICKPLPQKEEYKMITVLGNSFIYLRSKKGHQKALRDLFCLLIPNGKLIIQFRKRKESTESEWPRLLHRNLGISFSLKKATGQPGQFGSFAKKDEMVDFFRDLQRGDGFYYYDVPVDQVDGLILKMSRPRLGLPAGWYDEDDILHAAFGRAYIYPNGVEENIGEVQMIDYSSEHGYRKALRSMLENAGFKNIHLTKKPLSFDRKWWLFSVVAEKP